MDDVRENLSNFEQLDLVHRRKISEEEMDTNRYRYIFHTKKIQNQTIKIVSFFFFILYEYSIVE